MDQKGHSFLEPTYIDGYINPKPEYNDTGLPGSSWGKASTTGATGHAGRVLNESQRHIRTIDSEYAAVHQNTPSTVAAEAASAKQAANPDGNLADRQRAAAEHQAILGLVQSKQTDYAQHLVKAYAASGHLPFFLTDQIAAQRFREHNRSSSPQEIRSWLGIDGPLGESYRAAHQLKALAQASRILSDSLNELGQLRDQAEDAEPGDLDASIALLEARLERLRNEIPLQIWQLPGFAQNELIAAIGDLQQHTVSQQLQQHQSGAAQLAAIHRNAVGSAPATGIRSARPPLSKPELEALNSLLGLQQAASPGSSSHALYTALFHSESARYLEAAAMAFGQLQSRAAQAEARLNQAVVARDAQQSANSAAQAARAAQRSQFTALQQAFEASRTYAYNNAQAGSTILGARGFGAAPFTPQQLAALQAAIRSAVGQLAGAGVITAGVVSGFLVGILALAWPSSLANGERRVALSTPLSDLLDTNGLDLEGIAARGESIALSHSLMIRPSGNQAHLFVVPVPGAVPVLEATWDDENQQYSARLDSPPRIFTWTPAAPPGTQTSASTSLPAEQPKPAIYRGAALMPLNSPVKVDVGDNDVELGAQILIFPGTQMPPVLIMETRPPAELLEVGGYNDLSSRSRKDGMDVDHIPSRRALERFLKKTHPDIGLSELRKTVDRAASIAIPSDIHRQFSETMGGRNSAEKQRMDAHNLKKAVDSNFDAIKQGLLQRGIDEVALETARQSLHNYNQELGWYK